MKRITAMTIALALLIMNVSPVFALSDKSMKNVKKNNKSNRVMSSQVSTYKFDNVNVDWWKSYNDEYLEAYIVRAINNNYDLKVATLKVEEARQNVKLQLANELPSASLGVAPSAYKMPGVTNSESSFGLPVIVNYEADIFLKNHDKTKSKKKLHEISKFTERAAYISIASQIGAAYFNVVKLDKLIDIQNQLVQDRKNIYELMKQRNSNGITSTADLVRADKAYVLATADMVDLKKARNVYLNALAVLIGESPNNVSELKRISYDELMYSKGIPSEISSDIITQRPDYMAAEKQVEKAGIDVRVAKKEFLPKIDIFGLLFFSTGSMMGSMNWTNALAMVAGQAMLPLFTGGSRIASLRLSKNRYEQVLQNYYKTNLVAIQEVNDALTGLKLDNEKYNKNLKSLDMQKKDYKYTEQRYKYGIISNLDLIEQRENLLAMQKMVVSSKTDCFIDQINLYKAVGGKL